MMRVPRVLILAIIFIVVIPFAFAQRGGGRGGGGFHGGAGFRGGSGFRSGFSGGYSSGSGFRGGYGGYRGEYFGGYGGRYYSGSRVLFGFGGYAGYPYYGYGAGYPYGYYAYDPYFYDPYYSYGYVAQPAYTVPAPAPPPASSPTSVTQNYYQSAPPRQTQSFYRTPDFYLIAFTDGTIQTALTFYVDGDTLHWTTREHQDRQAPLSTVDRRFSEQINRDRRVEFRLP